MQDIRICYVGDSFVNGTGDPEKLGWTGRLSSMSESRERQITHYNLGVRRETSADILRRWEDEVSCRLVDSEETYVVFSFGVNDTVWEEGGVRIGLTESLENLEKIVLKAKKHYPVIMVGPPPVEDEEQNERIKRYDAAYREFCEEYFVAYLSIFDRLSSNETWGREVSGNDGAHPHAKGYKLLADTVYQWDTWWFKG
ncbi:MAG: GDSL-type esterase/lipase family protein [Sulfurovum sp.]|jgi:lysophospholipase L1-like esterase